LYHKSKVWIETINKGIIKIIYQIFDPSGESKANSKISANRKGKNIPIVIETWLNDKSVPEIYIGEIYFIINGVIELNNPAHIPWQNLTNKKI
jgi:hypothetical protein